MATAWRVGSNEQILTYGGVTRDYQEGEFSVWEGLTDTDHVADAEQDVLECHDDAASFDDTLLMVGSTNDATYFRIVRPADGEGHDGTSNNGFTISTADDANVIRINETFSQLQGLILTYSGNNASTIRVIYLTNSSTRAIGCIVFDSTNSGAGIVRQFEGSSTIVFVLCLSDNGENVGILAASSVRCYNCTSVNNGTYGFEEGAGSNNVVINCLGDNNTTADFDASGWHADSDYNASGDTSAPGGNSRTEQTFTFVNSGGNDFHLAVADAGADNFGIDLSADATFAFDDDIDKDLFDTWDIGFDENAVAAAGLTVSVNETITISERVLQGIGIQIAEAIGIAEGLNEGKGQRIIDNITLSELTQLGKGIQIIDDITTGEKITLGKGQILQDTITLVEKILQGKGQIIRDNITLSEDVTATLIAAGVLTASEFEAVTVGELLNLGKGQIIRDTINIAEQVTVELVSAGLLTASVNEAISLNERIFLGKGQIILDAISLSERVLTQTGQIIRDVVTLTELVQLSKGQIVRDDVTVSETLTAVLSPLLVSVNEAINLTESVTTTLSSALLSINVADNINVSDILTITLSALTQKIMFMLEIAKQRMFSLELEQKPQFKLEIN